MSEQLTPLTPENPQTAQANLAPVFLGPEQSLAGGGGANGGEQQLPDHIHTVGEKSYITIDQQIDSLGRANYYGIYKGADGKDKKKHIGRDAILETYGHAGDVPGSKPLEAPKHSAEPEAPAESAPRHARQELSPEQSFKERFRGLDSLDSEGKEHGDAAQNLIDDMTRYANEQGMDVREKGLFFARVVGAGADTESYRGKHRKAEQSKESQEYASKHRKEEPIPLVSEEKIAAASTPIFDALKADQASNQGEAETQPTKRIVYPIDADGKPLTYAELQQMSRDFQDIMNRDNTPGWGPETFDEEASEAEDDERIPVVDEDDWIPHVDEDDWFSISSDEPEAMAERRRNIFGRLHDRIVGAAVGAHGRLAESRENGNDNRKRNAMIAAGVLAVGAVGTLIAWKLGAFSGGGAGSHHSSAHEVLNGTINSHNPQHTATLEAGSNPWRIAEEQLKLQGNAHPTAAQIQAYDTRLGQANGYNTWSAWAEHARHLRAGTELKLPED